MRRTLDRRAWTLGRGKAGAEANSACLGASVVYLQRWRQDMELYGDQDRESH